MKYYEIHDRQTGKLLARGNARECRRQLGCASIDSFYALANRSLRGINQKYAVKIFKGGEVEYPVLGQNDPILTMEEERKSELLHGLSQKE